MIKWASFFKNNIDSFIAAVLGFIIIKFFTSHSGIGISPDSIAYTGVARNIVAGNGFTEFSGTPLVTFPLIYPLFLSLVMFITNLDIILAAPVLNGLMYAILIFISGCIIEKFKYKTNIYKRIILLISVISPSMIEIYTMLWSETLFVLLTLVFFLFFHRYLLTHRLLNLIYAAIVGAIAFDTRFAGITVIGAGCVLIFFDKNVDWKKKVQHILVFGTIGISLVAINLIRNLILRGSATGQRQKGITPLFKNVEFSGNVFSDWFTIDSPGRVFFIIFALAVMVLFIAFFVKNLRHWKAYYTYENSAVVFFIVYVSFIVLSSTISRYEPINNRLLAPAFLPLLWISTCQIPKWRASMPHRYLKWVFFAFSLGIAGALIAGYYAVNKENYSYMGESGIPGYSEDTWTQSETMHYVKIHPEIFQKDSSIYSNHSQAIYFHAGQVAIILPERVYKNDVKDFKAEPFSLLIWFNLDPNTDLLSLKEIAACKNVKCLKTFSDGAIYELKNKNIP